MSFKCPSCGKTLTVIINEDKRPAVTVDSVKALFPAELAELLTFEDHIEMVVVRPRQFLPSNQFAKVAETLKQAGGEYVRAGKESHFKVPKR